ncbi:MAG: hypothetical protein RL328_1818 [Acidobacteriota bacterium]|jgi:hypothetical protein
MSSRFERVTGQQHTRSVAFLLISIAGPAGLIATQPHGTIAILVTLAISAGFLAAAGVCRKNYSQHTVPSLDLAPRRR